MTGDRQAARRSWAQGADNLAGAQAPRKPCLTTDDDLQNRGSRFVYNIYLHLIYRTCIYRYNWNHSKTAVKPFRPSQWPLLRMSMVEQQGWKLVVEWAS